MNNLHPYCYFHWKEIESVYLYKNEKVTLWKKVMNIQSIDGDFYQIHWKASKWLVMWSQSPIFLDMNEIWYSEIFPKPEENQIVTYTINKYTKEVIHNEEQYINVQECSPWKNTMKELPSSYYLISTWPYVLYLLLGFIVAMGFYVLRKKSKKKS